jgi:ParB-like chromosome segregation protein Spo0J
VANERETLIYGKLETPESSEPTIKRIYRRRIKIDPKMVRRFHIKLGEHDYETFSTPRGELDWTKSEGRNSGWADVEELAESIKRDGIIHTPLVCSFKKFTDSGGGDEIFAVQGWRRIRAAVLNKQEYIDVDYTEDLTPEEAEVLSFKENYNRKNLSDTEISQFLWRVKQRHPDWTYQKIGETYGIGGKNPESKRKAVASYIAHQDFLTRHQRDVQELDINPKKLTRNTTIQIQATAREIATNQNQQQIETEILKTITQNNIPATKLCKTLRTQHKQGNKITPQQALNLIKTETKNRIQLVLPNKIIQALQKYQSKTNPNKNHETIETTIIKIL